MKFEEIINIVPKEINDYLEKAKLTRIKNEYIIKNNLYMYPYLFEDIRDYLLPKSKTEIINNPEFWKYPKKTLEYGLRINDEDIVKKSLNLLNFEDKRYILYTDKIIKSGLNKFPILFKQFILNSLKYQNDVTKNKILSILIEHGDEDLIKQLLNNIYEINTYYFNITNFKKLKDKELQNYFFSLIQNKSFKNRFAIQTKRMDLFDKSIYKYAENLEDEEIPQYISGFNFKRGFKLYKILKFIHKNKPKLRDLQKFIFEFVFKDKKFDPIRNRGHYMTNLTMSTTYSSKNYSKYLIKNPDKTYSLSPLGIEKMKYLEAKFKKQMPKFF